jgi:hypothetical protein
MMYVSRKRDTEDGGTARRQLRLKRNSDGKKQWEI